MPPTIQRTWGVFFNQWSRWSYDDPEAQLLLEMLSDLGQAVDSRNRDEADPQEARQVFRSWNGRGTVKHGERDLMRRELVAALDSLGESTLDSIFDRPTTPLADFSSRNVYLSEPLRLPEAVIKPGGTIPSTGTTLCLQRHTLNEAVLEDLTRNQRLRSLHLVKCQYPEDWDDTSFQALTGLRKLVFYSAHGAGAPRGRLAGVARLSSLRILELIMADFLHHPECYEQLATMTQLTTLDLARTLTHEKTKSWEKDVAFQTLQTLIRTGDLVELNLAWCSAFTRMDLQVLAKALAWKGGRLLVGNRDRQREATSERD
ncbi:hypothetical protein LY474_00900 [Myxococcus stipitatus]|uniref:hypothetical protein n=1 Tax=Myxococcus stipitatus TaxID=83455 RepID=UPI001F302A01|nr:hypothetical protein [Myxococcus stipitatus]MCE9666355.1 hypothetical protein [Myxococcus stipitatus]